MLCVGCILLATATKAPMFFEPAAPKPEKEGNPEKKGQSLLFPLKGFFFFFFFFFFSIFIVYYINHTISPAK
jgi:hypothetical protein